jgi:hypothetical protein
MTRDEWGGSELQAKPMSFSIKWLFGVVAIAAIFTAALVYRTPLWTFIAINTAVVVLLAATIGVWLRRLNRTFWLAFCVVGWFYLAVSFVPVKAVRLVYYIPSNYISVELLRPLLEAEFGESLNEITMRIVLFDDLERIIDPSLNNAQTELVVAIRRTADIIHALSALVASTLSGIISVLLIRQTREA